MAEIIAFPRRPLGPDRVRSADQPAEPCEVILMPVAFMGQLERFIDRMLGRDGRSQPEPPGAA